MTQLFDLDLERRVLSLLSDTSALDGADKARMLLDQNRLAPEDFHDGAHAEVFGAIVSLLSRSQPADAASVWTLLQTSEPVRKAGGAKWLTGLLVTDGFVASAFGQYAKNVRDLALRRQMVRIARHIANAAADLSKDSGQTLAGGSSGLAALVRRDDSGKTLQDVLLTMVDEIEEVHTGKRAAIIPTGIEALDGLIGGLQPTLTVIGSLPGVGKSALLATIARNVADSGVRIGIFSLEDQATWLGYRLLSAHSGINQFVLRNKRLTDYQLGAMQDGCNDIHRYGANVLIDDRVGLSPQEVANTARDWVVNRGVKAVLVDHLGELRYHTGRKDRFDLDVAEGLSELRAIAKQYGVPVVCATHLTRQSQDREVRLTDFANSAAIERQARVALGLIRPLGANELVVKVLKQTNGAAGDAVALDFYGEAALVRNTGGRKLDREAA